MPVTNYIWDVENDSYLGETDESGNTTAVYTSEPEQYGRVISQRRGNDTSYYQFDALGSTRQLTNSSQVVTDTNLYDAWGVNATSSGATVNPFRFIGERAYYHAPENLSYLARARTFGPAIARWTSVRSAAKISVSRQYLYAHNNPVRFADPSGRDEEEPTDDDWKDLLVVTCEWSPAVETGKCGGAYHRLCFVKVESKFEGWIVQSVGAVLSVRDCENVKIGGTAENYCEAWQVDDKGEVHTGEKDIVTAGGRDEFRFIDQGWGTRGRAYIKGQAYFLPDYQLKYKDEGGPWDRPGAKKVAGHLPTLDGPTCREMLTREVRPGQPSIWHDLQVRWDCCCGEHIMYAAASCTGCDEVAAGRSHCMGSFLD